MLSNTRAFQQILRELRERFQNITRLTTNLTGFHYWCGFIKFGIGRCTHEASQEVRNGHIDREEALALVKRFDGEFPQKHFEEVLDYLGLSAEEFLE